MKSVQWVVVALGVVVGMAAQAGEYQCTVYCKSPDGKTAVVVKAGSSGEAADIVDKQSDEVCRAAGHGRSTASSMSSSQCKAK